jgi:16S rRNA G966 N2-methylase RsmD
LKDSNPFDCIDEMEIQIENEVLLDDLNSLDNLCMDEINLEGSDPWEDAINDNKFYINNRIARIFPVLKNYNNYGKIKIDDDSFSYITVREIAEYISKIVCYHLLKYNVNPQKSILIDYTSGVGGNVLSFCRSFSKIYAIELITERCEYLINNIGVYGFKNITVVNQSAIDYNEESLLNVNPNVVFVDPPWGGNDYKNSDTLLLKLGDLTIEELIINIITKFSNYYKNKIEDNIEDDLKDKIINNNYNNKLIVLKLPKNYDIEFFYDYIKKYSFPNYVVIPYLYILNKMLIIIVELSYY